MKLRIISLFMLVVLLLGGAGVLVVSATSDEAAEEDAPQTKFYVNSAVTKNKGYPLGAEGYDVVAYFDENAAVPGAPAYQEKIGQVYWRFKTAENRDKFLENPGKYLPKYGGHCAYGTANGYLVRGDPQAWTVRDGALYLNYNKSVRRAWLANDKAFIAEADENWPRLAGEGEEQ